MPTYDLAVTSTENDGDTIPAIPLFTNDDVNFGAGQNWEPDNEPQHAFLWVTGGPPQGSTITAAYLVLQRTLVSGTAGSPVNLKIRAVDEDESSVAQTQGQWNTDHTLHTTAAVDWDFNSAASGEQQSVDISSVIQEIVDRAGYTDTFQIHIDDDGTAGAPDGCVQFWATEEHASLAAPVLHIETAGGGGGGYLVHEEDGTSRFTLEDDTGFLILEETVAATPQALPNRLRRILSHPTIRM